MMAVMSHSEEPILGSGVSCGLIANAVSYCNMGDTKQVVFCLIHSEAISCEPMGQANQSRLLTILG
jgi:hypothetical protein